VKRTNVAGTCIFARVVTTALLLASVSHANDYLIPRRINDLDHFIPPP